MITPLWKIEFDYVDSADKRGAKPAELPDERLSAFELVINVKAAKSSDAA
jgi:hypothetical protein